MYLGHTFTSTQRPSLHFSQHSLLASFSHPTNNIFAAQPSPFTLSLVPTFPNKYHSAMALFLFSWMTCSPSHHHVMPPVVCTRKRLLYAVQQWVKPGKRVLLNIFFYGVINLIHNLHKALITGPTSQMQENA